MAQSQISLHSLRLGELFALALGFGLSTLVVSARIYTKKYLTRKMRMEDCELTPLDDPSSQVVSS